MKVSVGKMGHEKNDILGMSIRKVAGLFHEVVDSFEDAELIIVSSAQEALTMLKENEEATVAIFVAPNEKQKEIGVRSLQKAFPGRVDLCTLLDPKPDSSDKMLVVYLMEKGGRKVENIIS